MPFIRFSTFWVSVSVWTRVELAGIVIATGKLGLDDWSSRFTLSSGRRAREPMKNAPVASRVSRR